MTTATLTPNLWAAHDAARRLQDEAQFAAAWHLAPQTIRVPDGLAHAAVNDKLAREFAEVARAARYEAAALASEARGGCGR